MVRSAITLGLLALLGASAQADPLEILQPQDHVRLTALEWLPAKSEFREWTAVNGEYTVDPDGTIVVPFAGRVAVNAKTLDETASMISALLQEKLSLPGALEVNLQVVSRLPVYVLGGVERPGRIDYTPGLQATQAIALAGGYYRGDAGGMRLERDTINAETDLRAARIAVARLKARVARLDAESSDATVFDAAAFGNALSGVDPALVAEEANLFNVRRQALQSQIDSLKSRRQLAVDQLKALDEQAENLDKQIGSTNSQLGDVKGLVDKGLAVSSRAYDLERTLTDLEGRRLDLQIGRLSTTLEVNESERRVVDLVTAFRTDAASDLQTSRSDLAAKALEVTRAEGLLREASVIAPEKLMDRAGNISVGVRVFVTRTLNGRSSTVEVARDAALQPGDTLQVQLEAESVANPGNTQGSAEQASPDQGSVGQGSVGQVGGGQGSAQAAEDTTGATR